LVGHWNNAAFKWGENQILISDWTYFHCPDAIPTPRVSVVAGFLQHWFFFPGMAECHNLLLSPSRKLALTKEKNGMEEDWEIEEEDGGWSDDEDQEARQAREFKKGLDRESG